MASKFEDYLLEHAKIDDGPPTRYRITPTKKNLDGQTDEKSMLRRFTLGKKNHSTANKTILLVGATGSGKSTLINSLLNFVMGVKFEDKIWFEIVEENRNVSQSESQTSKVTVYEMFGFEGGTVPFSLTVIDTPGYGDTRGIDHDDMVAQKLQELFSSEDGVDTINAVGLVLKSSENRLDERLVYIFNSVTELFGKDMKKSIVALITHSDGMAPEDALKALEDADIQFAKDDDDEPVYFLFNNRQTTAIQKKTERAAKNAWDVSTDGLDQFADFLGRSAAQKLNKTVEVINERESLEACIQNLQERIESIEKNQKAIEENKKTVKKHEKEMENNKDFMIPEKKIYKDQECLNHHTVCCNRCKETCHNPCGERLRCCRVMKNSRCVVCSGKCDVSEHVKVTWKYVDRETTVWKTREEMKAEYEKNKSDSEKGKSLIELLEKKKEDLQEKKDQYLDEAYQHVLHLEQIALNSMSSSTFIHLDFLIQHLKEKGAADQVQKLEQMKDRTGERVKTGASYIKFFKGFQKH